MKFVKSVSIFFVKSIWYVAAVLIIATAVLVSAVRMSAPFADYFRVPLVNFVQQESGANISVSGLRAEWNGVNPLLHFDGVSLYSKAGNLELFSFERVTVGLDLFSSAQEQRIKLSQLEFSGANIYVTQKADGAIGVAGVDSEQKKPAALNEEKNDALGWLFSQKLIKVTDSKVVVRKVGKKKWSYVFSGAELVLKNDGHHHRLYGSTHLPGELGEEINVTIDLQGDIATPGDWGGRFFMQGTNVRPLKLSEINVFSGVSLSDETLVDFKAWGAWENSQLNSVQGSVSISKSHFENQSKKTAKLTIDRLNGQYYWQRKENGWSLIMDDLVATSGKESWRLDQAIATLKIDKLGARTVKVGLGQLPLSLVGKAAVLNSDLSTQAQENIEKIDMEGSLLGVYAYTVMPPGERLPKKVIWQASLSRVNTKPWLKIPGVKNLSASLRGVNKKGKISLSSQNAELVFSGLFRRPVPIKKLSGDVVWGNVGRQWVMQGKQLLATNDEVKTKTLFSIVTANQNQKTFLDLDLHFNQGKLSSAQYYLPVSIMKPGLIKWLDNAGFTGEVSNGRARVNGFLEKKLFSQGKKGFAITFDVEYGRLLFAEQWPEINDIEAKISFVGKRMEVAAHQATTLSTNLKDVTVTIPNLSKKPAMLLINGVADGVSGDVLRYLRQSPLNEVVGKYFAEFEAKGQSHLNLSLSIPMEEGAKPRLNGLLGFKETELWLTQGSLRLSALNGELSFTEQNLEAKKMTAQVYGLPATISVATKKTKTEKEYLIHARGLSGIKKFSRIVDIPLVFDNLSGRTAWGATLHIPTNSVKDARLVVRSDLVGVDVMLPKPFNKSLEKKAPLQVNVPIPFGEERPITFSYDNQLQGVVGFARELPDNQVDRVTLQLGKQKAVLPKKRGIKLSGELDQLVVQHWLDFSESVPAPKRGAKPPLEVNYLDIHSKKIISPYLKMTKADLKGERTKEAWLLDISSQEIAGHIVLPHREVEPVRMDLAHLYITKEPGAESSSVDPRSLRPIVLESKRLFLNNKEIGHLVMDMRKGTNGVVFNKLQLKSDILNLHSPGRWTVLANKQLSSFDIDVTGKDLGKTLTSFGFVDAVEGGRSDATLNADWPGAPYDFAFSQLQGKLKLRVKEGRLLSVDPGAGRVFGLLSLQALPRRLTLDFGDLFQKGLAFDRVAGNFDIKEGNAYTSDLVLEGPAAEIKVSGRVGLKAKDYDQVVVVSPHLSSSLPIAGALAAGPQVGAAIYLIQKIFKPKIDKITTSKYSVKGSWDNPVVEPIISENTTKKKSVKSK